LIYSSKADVKQKSNIFDGISIFVNGHTNPTADELKRIMLENGGMFHHYQRSHTRFVIASNLPDVKIRQYNCKNIIKPEWIVDSLKAQRLLDYSPYLLVVNTSRTQPSISFNIKQSTNAETSEVKEENDDSISFNLKSLNEKLSSSSSSVVKSDRPKTAADPGFLEEFFENSRLHHIATLGADFKYFVSNLRKNHDGNFPGREVLLQSNLKDKDFIPYETDVIMHIDMDCFFVSVSIRKHPHLRGFPVAVTHSKAGSTGIKVDFDSMAEIASCSYEARAKGLKNGMFIGQALKLCPDLKTIPYNFKEYRETALALYNTVAKYTVDIEAVSCDELYANLKTLLNECQIDADDFAKRLRDEIFEVTGCTCSVGIGLNRLQARMATKKAKPNGQFSLIGHDVTDYMKDIGISELPGVGRNIAFHLRSLGIEKCEQLQKCPLVTLQGAFGKKLGESLQLMSLGIDHKSLVYHHVRKSVSVEVNYGIRFVDETQVSNFMEQISKELNKRLVEINKSGKSLTLKLMLRSKEASVVTKKFMGHGEVDRISKSVTLSTAVNDFQSIYENVKKLMKSINYTPQDLRGIGIQMSKLDEEKQEKKENLLVKLFENHQVNPNQPSTSSMKDKVIVKTSPSKKGFKNVKGNKSIDDMFKKKKMTNKRVGKLEKIDPDVLAELPPDIVEEILRDYQIDDDEEEVKIEEKIDEKDKIDISDNIFFQPDWRDFVLSYLDEPEGCEFIEQQVTNLVLSGDIDLLYLVMKFFKRKLGNDFNETLKTTVDNEMMKKYSKTLCIL
jgi:DNA repair protein REV1